MIRVDALEKAYSDTDPPTVVLQDVSFSIDRGEFVSIVGPSGSGKSTLLNLLSFFDKPTGGSYFFNERDTREFTDKDLALIRNKEIGFVFQSFNLLSRASVYENVEIPLLYSQSTPERERKGRIEKAVSAVGLSDKLHTEAAKLSGGQKQRVAIARALVNDPNTIFADEPTGNLDSASGAQVMSILEELNTAGHTIILVTHETSTAEFANRILRIRDGRLESDTPVVRRRTTKDLFVK